MIGRRELIGAMATSAVAGLAGPAHGAQAAAAGKGLRVAQGARWVAIGDSITDAGRAKPIGEGTNGLGTGYVQTMDAMTEQGTARRPVPRVRYPKWMMNLLGED